MKKTFKKNICIALALFMVFAFCSCSGSPGSSGSGNQSGKLDLDYEEGTSQQPEEQQDSGGNWFSEAFNFGKKDETGTEPQNSQPSGLEDLYSDPPENSQQGNSQSQSGQAAGSSQSGSSQPGNTQSGGSGNQGQGSVQHQQTGSNTGQSTDNGQNGIAGSSGGNSQSGGSESQGSSGSSRTVTITIRCDTAVKNGMHLESKWAGIVPASGCILPVTTVEIDEGQTVFDVLAYVCSKYKIHMSYRGGTSSGCYVDGINNLYEFDGGRWSGWMYCVNKWYPNYGCGVYYVKAGDEIQWNYTCDLGLDLEGADIFGAQEWMDTHQ